MRIQYLLRKFLPFYGKVVVWFRLKEAIFRAENLSHFGPRPKKPGLAQDFWDIDEADFRSARKEVRMWTTILSKRER